MNILLIDDEIDLLDVVADQIEAFDLNLNILRASSVEEASVLVNQADFIISDINMPKKEQLQNLLDSLSCPIARITGNDDYNLCKIVIRKPFAPEQLKSAIKTLMELVNTKKVS